MKNQSIDRNRKDFNLSNQNRIYDRNEINSLEIFNQADRVEIDLIMRDIDSKIEEIGKLCDKKKEKTNEDYKNVIKHNKSQLNEELSKLKLKLIDSSNISTKDDMLNKLKKELNKLKDLVFEKDKELQGNNLQLNTLENKVVLMKEDKEFFNKEISNAKKYNLYLREKLKRLEEDNLGNSGNSGNSADEQNTKNDNSFYTNQKLKTSFDKQSTLAFQEEEFEKLENFFKRNEQILTKKIKIEENGIKNKFAKLKALEKFNNPILNILVKKQKEYESYLLNSRTSNQEVFFNVPEVDLSGSNTSSRLLYNYQSNIDSNLNKIDRKEIAKKFLEDEDVKRFLYEALY